MHEWQRTEGQGLVSGHKVGCTSAATQKILSVSNPCFGGVIESKVHQVSVNVHTKDFQQVGIECEIVVGLSADLLVKKIQYNMPQNEAAIDTCIAAIEVVNNRYGDFLCHPTTVLIANDFFQGSFVLGAEISDWRGLDLADTEGRVYINGRLQGSGLGADILGHPLQVIFWLANRMSALGRGLNAGEFILTG